MRPTTCIHCDGKIGEEGGWDGYGRGGAHLGLAVAADGLGGLEQMFNLRQGGLDGGRRGSGGGVMLCRWGRGGGGGGGETHIGVAIVGPLVQPLHRVPNAHGDLGARAEVGADAEVEVHGLPGVLLGVEVAHAVAGVGVVAVELGLRVGGRGGGRCDAGGDAGLVVLAVREGFWRGGDARGCCER